MTVVKDGADQSIDGDPIQKVASQSGD